MKTATTLTGLLGEKKGMARNRGFTLIELMITIVIAAIALTFATPSFLNMIERSRVRTTTENLMDLLQVSRVIAVEQRNEVVICGSSDQTNCDQEWGKGILAIKVDSNGNTIETVGSFAINQKVSVIKRNSNQATLDYSATGWLPGDQTRFEICPVGGKQQNAYRLVIAMSGKVRKVPSNSSESFCTGS